MAGPNRRRRSRPRFWGGQSTATPRELNDLLDDITLYWLTNTGVSSGRLYWETHFSLYAAIDVSVPAAITVFPGENYEAPRSWTARAYRNLIYFHQVDRGGHYAAWEQPQLFSEEVRAGLRSLRSS
jgi:pimeloyl-ACP methyl ester carboxylesterase